MRFLANGTILSIAPSAATEPANAAAYAALTWTAAAQVVNIGEFGAQTELIETSSLEDDWVERLPGREDGGVLDLVLNYDDTLAGQTAFRTAAENKELQYPFKIEVPNKQNATGVNGKFYFFGRVGGTRYMGFTINGLVQVRHQIAVNTRPVVVVSTAGA